MSKTHTWQANAVVTGAGSGIGQAFALELARRNGHVICADIQRERAEETVRQIRQTGGYAHAIKADVSILADVEALAQQAEHWCGSPINLVINNAGVGVGGNPIGNIPIEDWRWAIETNMWGVIHGCHVFVPKLRALGQGGIINVCSTASFAAAPLMAPYNASKAAVLSLSETLAAELRGSGISVTALCPTFVKTNIARDGRISNTSASLAQKVMSVIGSPPKNIAIKTLNDLDKGKLYVIPQIDAQCIWRVKRLLPSLYTRSAGLIRHLSEKS